MEVEDKKESMEVEEAATEGKGEEEKKKSEDEMKKMKERLDQIAAVSQKMSVLTAKLSSPDVANPEAVKAELETLTKLAAQLMSATDVAKGESDPVKEIRNEFPFEVRFQGAKQHHMKDLKSHLKRTIDGKSFKFAPVAKGATEVSLFLKTDQDRTLALKILNDKPLGISIEAKPVKNPDLEQLPYYEARELLIEALKNGPPQDGEEYLKQLRWKSSMVAASLYTVNENLKQHVKLIVKDRTEGFVFKLESIQPCPLDLTYAERIQLFSGLDKKTGELSLDYSTRGGREKVDINPNSILAKPIQVIKDYIQLSKKPLYNPKTKEGYWVEIVARSSHCGYVMLVVSVRTATQAQGRKECDVLASALRRLFTDGSTAVVSLIVRAQYQDPESEENWKEVSKVVFGEDFFIEETVGLKFRIHYNTFFWANPYGVQVLCENVAKLLELNENTAVLEIGGTTGVFGLYMSQLCGKVFLIAKNRDILYHSGENAALNEITNCEFLEGGVEPNIQALEEKLAAYTNVVAVISDCFSATGSRDAQIVRKIKEVKKVVCVTMAMKECIRNFTALCSEGEGVPFVPVRAVIVDPDPKGKMVETIFLLERQSDIEDKLESLEDVMQKKKLEQERKWRALQNGGSERRPTWSRRDSRSPPRRKFRDDRGRRDRFGRGSRFDRRRSRSRSRDRRRRDRSGGRRRDYSNSYSRDRGSRRSSGKDSFGRDRDRDRDYGRGSGGGGGSNLESAILNVIKNVVGDNNAGMNLGNQNSGMSAGGGGFGQGGSGRQGVYNEGGGGFRGGSGGVPGQGARSGPYAGAKFITTDVRGASGFGGPSGDAGWQGGTRPPGTVSYQTSTPSQWNRQ